MDNYDRLNALFSDISSDDGPATTVAGEIVRATEHILIEFYDAGHRLGVLDGIQTCNYAGRYLCDTCGDAVGSVIEAMWGIGDVRLYEDGLDRLVTEVLDYLDGAPELAEAKNNDDMTWHTTPEEEEDDGFDDIWTGEVFAVYDPD